MNKIIYTIDEIKEKSTLIFKRYPYVEKAYLFGSYARNEATSKSDLDFYVIIQKNKTGMWVGELLVDLQEEFDKPIDLLTQNEIKSLYIEHIKNEEVFIYEVL